MKITEWMKQGFVLFDGGMGTMLQSELQPGELPERLNLQKPQVILNVHRQYVSAGAQIITSNTFGANRLKFEKEELEQVVTAGVKLAKEAAKAADHPCFTALDIGPTGKLLAPLGDLDFEKAVEIFAETVKIGVRAGADLVLIETMNDCYETKAALLAAKENCDLPVFVSNAYGADSKLMTGATPDAMVALLEGMGADALGANCSLSPTALFPVVRELTKTATVPVLFQPNAGLPHLENGKTVFDVTPVDFAKAAGEAAEMGVRLFGGCCGTTPAHIAALKEELARHSPKPLCEKNLSVISSYTHAVYCGQKPLRIGERLNPTGKKRLKEALLAGDMDYLLKMGILQEEEGADALDVNVGLPLIDEPQMLAKVTGELQAVTALPLAIDTASPIAMEKALRRYNGKAMINSVNGKEESMRAVFPLMKKYGGLAVALTLDEKGIPATAKERVAVAEKIIKVAAEYGIAKKDLIFDPLAMPVSADRNAAAITLETVRILKEKLQVNTSLGISNVSFGLPEREAVTGAFFAAALARGLSAAILNPASAEIKKVYYTYLLLTGQDENCADYLAHAAEFALAAPSAGTAVSAVENSEDLKKVIFHGRKEQAAALTEKLLKTSAAMEVVNDWIIPALDAVGVGFEEKKVYLPQLLMSAEAASYAFEVIRSAADSVAATKPPVVLATVQGDIHDIGKNIVRLLLENYGFPVTDLGRDVPPEAVVEAVQKTGAPLVGLSALMTTTLPSMEKTVALLKKECPHCHTVVGGAVLTKDYAEKIGADCYARDAMETVRFAEKIVAGKK